MKKQKKKGFMMPHLLWIMTGLIFISCLATYLIPAGQFAVTEAGDILGDQFTYLGHQTPVNPWQALMMIREGMTGSATIIFVVLISGANIGVILSTGAIDDFMNWAIYKLKDKGKNVLIILMMILMAYLGGFGGTDALIAVVPVGVLFAKKLKLDPICALGVTTFSTLLGFGTGPAQQATTQMLIGVPPYSSFITRFIVMNMFIAAGIIMVLRYVKKIENNPEYSLMYSEGWRPDVAISAEEEAALLKKVDLTWRKIAVIVIFFSQYIIIVAYSLFGGDSSKLFNFMMAVMLVAMVLVGFFGGMSADELGNSFAKGLSSMAFVGFVIGLARVISLVLGEGNVLHTIVFVLTRPLMDLPRSVASVGLTAVIALINPLIPSATSKAAILIPIIKPVAETLGLNLHLAVMAFQMGDGFTNLISPLLGWMIGSCAMANVPYQKWFKWVFPKVLIFLLIAFALVFILTISGWTGLI